MKSVKFQVRNDIQSMLMDQKIRDIKMPNGKLFEIGPEVIIFNIYLAVVQMKEYMNDYVTKA